MAGEEDLENVYSVLGSTVKRRIIQLLAERGPLSFTEIRRAVDVGVGTLYYNLDSLRGFVEKGEDKRYYLTERGKALHAFIREGDERIKSIMATKGRLRLLLEGPVMRALVPTGLVVPLYGNDLLSAAVMVLTTALGVAATLASRLELVLLEVRPTPLLLPKTVLGLDTPPEALLLLNLFLSLAIAVSASHAAAHLVTGHTVVKLGFASAISLSYAPIYVYMLAHYLTTGYSYPEIPEGLALALAVILRLLQLLSLGIITASISVFYNTSKERGFLVAAILLYLSFLLNALLP